MVSEGEIDGDALPGLEEPSAPPAAEAVAASSEAAAVRSDPRLNTLPWWAGAAMPGEAPALLLEDGSEEEQTGGDISQHEGEREDGRHLARAATATVALAAAPAASATSAQRGGA